MFKWVKVFKLHILGEIMPERLRLERFREVICVVFGWQLIPLQEHQMLLEFEGVFFQSSRWFRGSMREDFIERRVMS